MIWAIIKTFAESVMEITRKKSLDANTLDNANIFNMIGILGGLILAVIFVAAGMFSLPSIPNQILTLFIILFLVSVLINIFSSPIWQEIYKNEKVSNIMPYEVLKNLFVIMAGFFILDDGSSKTFGITVFTILVIMLFSIDLKTISMPKNIRLILGAHTLAAMDYLLAIWILKYVSEISFFVMDAGLSMVILIMIILIKDGYRPLQKLSRQNNVFWVNRIISGLMGYSGYIIALFLLKDLGPVMTMLLGFLGMFSTIIFSYIFLGEKPEKKSLALGVMVVFLVSIGYWWR